MVSTAASDQGCQAELPFETEPDVDSDRDQRQHGGQQAGSAQLLAHFRADELGAAVFRHLVAERRLDRLDCRQLGRLIAFLTLDVDQDVVFGAELLQGHLAEAEPTEAAAQLGQIRRALCAHLDQGSAAEVDAEVEPLGDEGRERGQQQGRRKGDEQLAPAEKIDPEVDRDAPYECHSRSSLRAAALGAARAAASRRP
jgi:hypothetical protein